ncbi:hypothetical protein ACWD4G_33525 [Streptomyces sp. NPDC002643]
MSIPPQPQPPYGPPPHAAAPHGQPYPAPQASYGQQPYPPQQQPYYGQPPASPYGAPHPSYPHPATWAPPPKKKSGVGLALGIVGGIVGLVVIGTLGISAGSLREAGTPFPAAEYELVLSQTLLDGEYELAQDLGDSGGDEAAEQLNDASYARDVEGISGMYGAGGDVAEGQLTISGAYGRFKRADANRDSVLRGAATADGFTVVQEPTDFEPAGSDVTVTCQVLLMTEEEVTLPMCAWADGNTMAMVAEVTPEISAREPEEVDMAAFADRTVLVRSEIRQAIG